MTNSSKNYGNIFMTDVDTPVCHQLSRRLVQTRIGSRRPPVDTELNDTGETSYPLTTNRHDNHDMEGLSPDNNNNGDQTGNSLSPASIFPAAADVATPTNYVISGYCRYQPSSIFDNETIPDEMKTNFYDPVGKSPSIRDLIDAVSTPGRPEKQINSIFNRKDKDAFKNAILSARIIIVDFIHSVEDVPFIMQVLIDHAEQFVDNHKILIGISTVLTWGRTKPDLEDPEAPISEEEYRRRKPHPNYRVHVALEKEWVKLTKMQCFHSFIIFSGLVFHIGESPFHSMLKAAWHGSDVPVYGEGDNILPMVHLDDLCEIIVLLVETCPLSMKYILAIDNSHTTYSEIAKAISQNLGTGRVKMLPKEHALLDHNLNQYDRDCLGINLNLEPSNIKKLPMKWKYEDGLIEGLAQYINEYRHGRGVTPLKILILGPPQVGKTYYAQKIAAHYQLPYIDVKTVMKETIERLQRRVQWGMISNGGGEGFANDNKPKGVENTIITNSISEEVIDSVDLEGEKELLDELTEYSKNNDGAYPDVHIISFLRAKLLSMACQNQGYVIDAYPTTQNLAEALFRKEDGEGLLGTPSNTGGGIGGSDQNDENKTGGSRPNLDSLLLPDHVIVLDAPDEWIKDICMQQPDTVVTSHKVTENIFMQRLSQYREQNIDDVTILNVFDEIEIHPTFFNVATGMTGPVTGVMALVHAAMTQTTTPTGSSSSPSTSGPTPMAIPPSQLGVPTAIGTATRFDIKDLLLKHIGKPHNYGPSKEDIILSQRIKAEEAARIARQMEEDETKRQKEERERHAKALADWNAKLEEVKRQEQEVLEAQSLPLRHYLMQHVMPTLSLGLMEVCKVRPEDPVDYLAEFLFRQAPISLDILDPSSGSTQLNRNLSGSQELPPPTILSRSPSKNKCTSRPTSVKNATPLPPITSATVDQGSAI